MAYTTIDDPTEYFETTLFTGNGSTQNITGLNFQPDWIWYKRRNSTNHNRLIDSVRGSNKNLASDLTNAENTESTYVTSFNSDGWSIGSNTDINASNDTIVAWAWKAGGSASSNSDGSITSSVSASTDAGFSIVSYTGNATNGATVGHGLGAVPEMLIGKDLSDTSGWGVWHKDLTNAGYRLDLSTNAAQSDDTALFGGSSRTAPTSSVFTLGSGGGLNGSNANIMYAFTSITGYSKFGSYIGNNNADGTFIYTGFAPAFVMVKRAGGGSQSWGIVDNKRSNYNLISAMLNPDSNGTEGANNGMDLLSNGFKMRSSDGNSNGYADTHIYMAFAEAPLVGSNGVTAKAR